MQYLRGRKVAIQRDKFDLVLEVGGNASHGGDGAEVAGKGIVCFGG